VCGAIHPLPHYAFMAWCSVKKHRGKFTLPFKKMTFVVIAVRFLGVNGRRKYVLYLGKCDNLSIHRGDL